MLSYRMQILLLFLQILFFKDFLIVAHLFFRNGQLFHNRFFTIQHILLHGRARANHAVYNKIMSISHIQIKSSQHLLFKRQEITANNVLPVGVPDAAVYYYFKQGTFLSKKQERWTFYFFQGLNTNPQNLSIFLRDEAQRENKSSKEKLSKGIFMVFDLFSKCDTVIEINIPGNLKIFKVSNSKKELVNNEQIDLMYLSSVFRTMYQSNLPWGRYYHLFHDSKNYIQELKNFYRIFFRSCIKKDINIGSEFQSHACVKGSHGCSLIFKYMVERRLVRHSIEKIGELFKDNKEYSICPKFSILLAEFYVQFGKTSKSLEIVFGLLQIYPKDPYLLYYQAKYLSLLALLQPALIVANSIVQFNQFQIWTLLAQIHLQLKHFGDVLVCLNHAVKLCKQKGIKNLDIVYKAFEELGKVKLTLMSDSLQQNPKLLVSCDSPLSIMVKEVQEKNKPLIQRGYWKLNSSEKMVYNILQTLRYRVDAKRFEELIMSTFEENAPKFEPIIIKKGITQSLFVQEIKSQKNIQEQSHPEEEQQDLPDFLKDSIQKVQESVAPKPSRNLSIIQEIQSVIQNSNYQERQKQKNNKSIKYKREVNEGLYKIVQYIMAETEFQKAEFECNFAKFMNTYNKMRTSSKFNNYYTDRMFKVFVQTVNYKSIIVLIAETLDFLEQKGVKKIDKLPYWMHKYLFFIIEEKGLKFLNDMLQKLNFFDQAIIDTIQIAKNWKMKGITY